MNILHVITSLNDGGAQAVLYNLIKHDEIDTHEVVCLCMPGKYSAQLSDLKIRVTHLDMPRGRVSMRGLLSLYSLVKRLEPDGVQTWMYHSDLIGGVVSLLAGVKNITWGIHHSTLDRKGSSRSTRITVKLLRCLSCVVPKAIISCSRKAMELHTEIGYCVPNMRFVANGYDLNRFKPGCALLDSLEKQPEIPDGAFVFVTVARWDPQKDHGNLIEAASLLKKMSEQSFCCLLIGPNVNDSNGGLNSLVDNFSVHENVFLCGISTDVPQIMNYADCHVLPSLFGEAFPNVVAEAMSCGTPCVVTDVGDAAEMIADEGWVVPPGDAYGLAKAMLQVIEAAQDSVMWKERKDRCRSRAIARFDVRRMISEYQNVWREK